MCHSIRIFKDKDWFEEQIGISFERPLLFRKGTLIPGMRIPVLLNGKLRLPYFGFLGGLLGDETKHYYNARIETIDEKRTFANAFEHGRCVVLCNAFDERIRGEDITFIGSEPLLMFAGIFEQHKTGLGKPKPSVVIVTRELRNQRFPLFFRDNKDARLWLENPYKLRGLLDPTIHYSTYFEEAQGQQVRMFS